MQKSAFALALLAAGVTACNTPDYDPIFDAKNYGPQIDETEDTGENAILASFKAWNCATCTMAFGGLDKIIESETFFNNMTTFASWVCKASGQVKNSSEICPQIIN